VRILLDCSQIARGGGLQVCLEILRNAASTPGMEVVAVLSDAVSNEIDASTLAGLQTVYRLPATARTRFSRLWMRRTFLRKIEREARPAVVFTVFGPAYWTSRAPHVVGFAVPAIIYPEVMPPSQRSAFRRVKRELSYRIKRRFFRAADYWIVETKTVKRRLLQVLNVQDRRVFVVQNTHSTLFGEADDQGVDESVRAILVPASYYSHKNLEIIPQVAASLAASHPVTFMLTIPPTSREWLQIHEAAERLGVSNLVTTTGLVPHARFRELYRRCQLVFLPTLLECSTAVYPESFQAGVPLCTSDRDFARELCGDAAVYVDPLSVQSCASGLRELITKPDLRKELVDRGRRILGQRYQSPDDRWRRQMAVLCAVADPDSAKLQELAQS